MKSRQTTTSSKLKVPGMRTTEISDVTHVYFIINVYTHKVDVSESFGHIDYMMAMSKQLGTTWFERFVAVSVFR